MLPDNIFSRLAMLFEAGERKQYRAIVKALPRLIADREFAEIEQLLVRCGSFQVASNFEDIANVFRANRDAISKIVEIGTFNFASSTFINSLKLDEALFFGFDNWDLGGTEARLMAEWRSKHFPNSRVISGHPLSSPIEIKDLENTDMLVIDGNHSFQSTLTDCSCFKFLRDGATILFHDCGLGNRIWGCFWVYYLLQNYGVIQNCDDRFKAWIAAVDSRCKPKLNQGEMPEINFAIGRFNQYNFAKCQRLLSDSESLWREAQTRFAMRGGLEMTAQSHLWEEWLY
jgi:hypothetical protein